MALRDTAQRLVTKFGRQVQLIGPAAAPDPTKPWEGPVADGDTVNVPAVFDPSEEWTDAEGVARSSPTYYVASQDLGAFDPGTATVLVDGGRRYSSLAVEEVRPGVDSILWRIRALG